MALGSSSHIRRCLLLFCACHLCCCPVPGLLPIVESMETSSCVALLYKGNKIRKTMKFLLETFPSQTHEGGHPPSAELHL